eukprot:scaffold8755_cov46-Phaeocystis_antarctica.AAC.2
MSGALEGGKRAASAACGVEIPMAPAGIPSRKSCSAALVVFLLSLLIFFLLVLLVLLALVLLVLRHRPPLVQLVASLIHGGYRRGAGGDVIKIVEFLERRQHAAIERSRESGAAGVGDLGVAEAERLELRQHSSRRRWRTCRRRRRQEGNEALVAERVAP